MPRWGAGNNDYISILAQNTTVSAKTVTDNIQDAMGQLYSRGALKCAPPTCCCRLDHDQQVLCKDSSASSSRSIKQGPRHYNAHLVMRSGRKKLLKACFDKNITEAYMGRVFILVSLISMCMQILAGGDDRSDKTSRFCPAIYIWILRGEQCLHAVGITWKRVPWLPLCCSAPKRPLRKS